MQAHVHRTREKAVEAFKSAFRIAPEIERDSTVHGGIGLYLWTTPPIREFSLPAMDETVLSLHLGGSRQVRQITADGLSATCSLPGKLTLLPARKRSAFRTDGSVRMLSVHFPEPLPAPPGQQPLSLAHTEVRFAFRDDFLSAGAQALLRAAALAPAQRGSYFDSLVEAMVQHLRVYMSAEASSAADSLPEGCFDIPLGRISVADVQRYIDARLAHKISLAELAERAGISRAWFAHNFKLGTGMSPHQFLNRRRVSAACRLLLDTRLDLLTISHEVVFSSQSHFTSVFRAQLGCTPGQYRDSGGRDEVAPAP